MLRVVPALRVVFRRKVEVKDQAIVDEKFKSRLEMMVHDIRV